MSSAARTGLLLIAVLLPQRQDPHQDRADRQEAARDQDRGAVVQQDVLVAEEGVLVTLGPVVLGHVVDQPVDQQQDRDHGEDPGNAPHASSPSGGNVSVAAAPTPPAGCGSANGTTSAAAVRRRAPSVGMTERATRSASGAVIAASSPLAKPFDQVSSHIAYHV